MWSLCFIEGWLIQNQVQMRKKDKKHYSGEEIITFWNKSGLEPHNMPSKNSVKMSGCLFYIVTKIKIFFHFQSCGHLITSDVFSYTWWKFSDIYYLMPVWDSFRLLKIRSTFAFYRDMCALSATTLAIIVCLNLYACVCFCVSECVSIRLHCGI